MKIGLFAGGFKPFTTGHMSKLAVALQENDVVILFYGIASRTKGSNFYYTKEMSSEIYGVIKTALERTYGDKLIVHNPHPTPIVAVFSFIGAVKDSRDIEGAQLSAWGINPRVVEKITVYGDNSSLSAFTTDVIGKTTRAGEDKEQRYYGDMVSSGKLVFDNALTVDGGMDRMVAAMEMCGYKNDMNLHSKINVRGSQVRAAAQSCDWETIKKFLPNFLNSKEINDIIDIMQRRPQKDAVVENLIRSYVCEVIR